MGVIETGYVVPDRALGYLFSLVFFEPCNHERYGPITTSFVDLFYKIIEHTLIPFVISFRTTSFGEVECRDSTFVVHSNPSGHRIFVNHEVMCNVFVCLTSCYMNNGPDTCFMCLVVGMGKRLAKLLLRVSKLDGATGCHTTSMTDRGYALLMVCWGWYYLLMHVCSDAQAVLVISYPLPTKKSFVLALCW